MQGLDHPSPFTCNFVFAHKFNYGVHCAGKKKRLRDREWGERKTETEMHMDTYFINYFILNTLSRKDKSHGEHMHAWVYKELL